MRHLMLIAILLAAPVANAGFVVDREVPAEKKPIVKKLPRVQIQGDPVKFELARGMGRNVTLGEALAQIIPETWQKDLDEVPDLSRKVTWRGGSEWPSVLETTLAQVGLGATVVTEGRIIKVHPYRQSAEAPKPAVQEGGKEPAKVVPEEKPVAVPIIPKPVWRVSMADRSIRGALSRWAREAGWQVSWEATFDYPVTVEGDFIGLFDEAVLQVIAGLAGAEKPLQACTYDNRVVRIVAYGQCTPGIK